MMTYKKLMLLFSVHTAPRPVPPMVPIEMRPRELDGLVTPRPVAGLDGLEADRWRGREGMGPSRIYCRSEEGQAMAMHASVSETKMRSLLVPPSGEKESTCCSV